MSENTNNTPTKKNLYKMTKAICPKCKREHEKKLFWTDKTIPRIFCSECDHYRKSCDLDEYKVHHK